MASRKFNRLMAILHTVIAGSPSQTRVVGNLLPPRFTFFVPPSLLPLTRVAPSEIINMPLLVVLFQKNIPTIRVIMDLLILTLAYLKELRRVQSGDFLVDDSLSIDELRDFVKGKSSEKKFYYSPFEALHEFGEMVIESRTKSRVQCGASFKDDEVVAIHSVPGKPFRIVDEDKNLIAVAEVDVDRWKIRYLNVFNCGGDR